MEGWKDWDGMTEAQKFKAVYKTLVKRDGAETFLEWLQEAGFFEAPASTTRHGAFPGGLVAHSNNVYRRLVMLQNDPKMKPYAPIYTPETIAVVALLHDVCKTDVYREDEEDGSYSYNDPFPIGHGEKSVYYIQRFMKLGLEEALAIRWHMGAYDKAAGSDLRDLSRAQKKSKLVVMLHIADMMATHFDEAEV